MSSFIHPVNQRECATMSLSEATSLCCCKCVEEECPVKMAPACTRMGTSYRRGKSWNRKNICKGCGWNIEKSELKAGLCRTCRETVVKPTNTPLGVSHNGEESSE